MKYITRELERKFLKLNDFLKLSLLQVQDRLGKLRWSSMFHKNFPSENYHKDILLCSCSVESLFPHKIL